MKSTTSLLDPIPTSLFKLCFDALCPAVLSIINDSLQTGVVTAALKIAAVTPVPKKENVVLNDFNNFCPILNLPFLAKLLERIVAFHLCNHLTVNNLIEPLQSGFRKFHRIETALVNVTNDLLMASDSGATFVLILLDLRATFDTMDHSLLLTCLERVFGVSGTALKWLQSYFTERSQFVSIGLRLALSQLVYLRGQS